MIEPFHITSRIGTLYRCAVTVGASWNGRRLVLTGEVKHHASNDSREAGQITDAVRELNPRLADLWERWHLNDMRPGCEHQEAEYREHPAWRPSWSNDYSGEDTPCPVCGYKYGTAWNYEAVPDDVLNEVKEILSEGE